jgi:hypothetical protein
VSKRFPRNTYTVTDIVDIREMDLADLYCLSKHKNKYKYLFKVIYTFSRYAWIVTLNEKAASKIIATLKYLFLNRRRIPLKSSKGTEFFNTTVQRYVKQQGVHYHTTHNRDIKGAFIESFNIKF